MLKYILTELIYHVSDFFLQSDFFTIILMVSASFSWAFKMPAIITCSKFVSLLFPAVFMFIKFFMKTGEPSMSVTDPEYPNVSNLLMISTAMREPNE